MYMCDETMHARPDRKAPEDEEVKLVAAITSAASVMERAMKQLDYLQNKVKPVYASEGGMTETKTTANHDADHSPTVGEQFRSGRTGS